MISSRASLRIGSLAVALIAAVASAAEPAVENARLRGSGLSPSGMSRARRVLFAWELGAGYGHVANLLPQLGAFVIYTMMIVILILRPNGLFGKTAAR